jgi:hypothetical protein
MFDVETPARRLWPFAPTHLHLGTPLSYDMLRAAAAAVLLQCCFEATGEGWRAAAAAAAAQGVHEMQVCNRMRVRFQWCRGL